MGNKTHWYIFHKDNLLIENVGNEYHVPYTAQPPVEAADDTKIHTVVKNGEEFKAYSVNDEELALKANNSYSFINLRQSFDTLPLKEYKFAGKAFQVLFWDKNTKYCPSCGVLTIQISPIGKKCPSCSQEFYPPISPAIIVRIHKDDTILLVRARNFRGTFNGLVAGFVEPGESLEECVCREVMEETGLTINNIRYFGSQPWPYPSGLMIGFIADYAEGEIKLQDEELTSGAFFRKDNLPEIPRKLSIARKMIDAWLSEE